MLPAGVRARQLSVRTLLAGMCLTQADGRPAHLTRIRRALVSLPEDDQRRLGVVADWADGPHRLTYRQTEYTFGLAAGALAKDEPDGLPSAALAGICDDLLEASVPGEFKDASASLAVDWTDLETFSRPPPAKGGPCADPEASWGHRKNNLPARIRAVLRLLPVRRNHGARGEQAARPRAHPADDRVLLPPGPRPRPGPGPDGDAGTRHPARRRARRLRLRPPRRGRLGDPAPPDRGAARSGPAPARPRPEGTHEGAIIANGNLYCPATPRTLLELGPLARDATPEQAAAHDAKTAEPARYKLGRLTRDDEDGYHRVRARPSRARSAARCGRHR